MTPENTSLNQSSIIRAIPTPFRNCCKSETWKKNPTGDFELWPSGEGDDNTPPKGDGEAERADPFLAGRDVFLEQLLVRRDLAINFVVHNPAYKEYRSIPQWARRSLERHRADPRPYLYDDDTLENAATHDSYWNAAQRQMLVTGHMHNYMRMCWGKKIIEWKRDPEEAFHLLTRLNDTYQLDGRDANGYAGIAWCFGNHDRPWKERPVFGQVRYMNAAGLERKFSMETYVERYSK